jgi:hypothetical protein
LASPATGGSPLAVNLLNMLSESPLQIDALLVEVHPLNGRRAAAALDYRARVTA